MDAVANNDMRTVAEQQGALDECNAPWTTLLEQLADSSFVSEARAATLRAIADHLSCVRASPSQVAPANPAQVTDAMTPESYVADYIAHGERSVLPLPAWEKAYQDAGLIDEAQKLGYIWIGSDVACTVEVTAHGRTAAELHRARAALTAAIGAGGQAVGNEWTCPKCGAQADERFDCCEVHEQMQGVGERVAAWLWEHPEHALRVELHPLGDDDIDNDWRETRLYAHPVPSGQAVANIVPEGCTGKALAFDPGTLHVNKDGSGYIVVAEDEWQLEDDRCEGPDGPEGSVHWITRLDASEMQALRDFLNGAALSQPHPADERVVEAKWPAYCAHPGSCSRHRQCMYYGCKHEGTSISEAVDAALAATEGR